MKLTPNTITLVTPSMQSITLIFMGAFKGDPGTDGLNLPTPYIRGYFLRVNPISLLLEWSPVVDSGLRPYRSVAVVEGVLTIDCSTAERLLVSSGGNPYLSENVDDIQFTNLPPEGSVKEFTLEWHIDPDVGGYTVTYPSLMKHAGGPPALPVEPGAIMHVGYVVYSDGQVFGYPTPVFS